MSEIDPRLRDEDDDLDVFEDRPASDEQSEVPDLGGATSGPSRDDLLQPPDSRPGFEETEAKASGDDPEFNPDAANDEGEDGEAGENDLDYQLEERPDLSFNEQEEPDLDYAGPDDEITIASDEDAVVPELSSAETRDEIVFGDLYDDDESVPAVLLPEQEEPVIAGESQSTPVEESEPEDEPEPDPVVPVPRPPEDDETDTGVDGPEFRAFDEPRDDLELAVVEPEYEFTLDLGDDDDDDGGE